MIRPTILVSIRERLKDCNLLTSCANIGILAMQPFLEIYGTYNPAKKLYYMSAADQSLTTSIINAGEFVGAVTSYYLIDKLGRRGCLFVSSGTVVVGTIIQIASTHIASLIVGRLVLGMSSDYTQTLFMMIRS